MPFWLPQGTVLLKLIREQVDAQLGKRGYVEIRTPEILDVELWHRSGHYDNYRENMYFAEPAERDRGDERRFAREADELPRRLPRLRLRAPLLPRAAAAAGRVRQRLPLRARGRPARAAAGPRLHPGRRPRLLHARADRGRGGRHLRGDRRALREVRLRRRPASSSRPGRRSRSATTRSGSRPRRRCAAALDAQRPRVRAQPRRRRLLRPEDRLPRHRRARPLLAARHLPARLLHARALRPQLPGRRQRQPPPGDDPPRPARLDGALRRDPDRAPRRALPGLAGADPGAASCRSPTATSTRPRSLLAELDRGRRPRPGRRARRVGRAARSATPSSPRCPTCSSSATARSRRAAPRCAPTPTATSASLSAAELAARIGASARRRPHLSRVYTARRCKSPTPRRAAERPCTCAYPSSSSLARCRLDAPRPRLLVPVPRRFDRRPPERDLTRINERIRVPKVRLIGADGEQVGVVDTDEARRIAREADLDLVEVAPDSRPPVCRLLDYSKYKYEQEQKAKAGPQAPAAGQRPRDQAAAEDRRPRLRDQEGPRRALPQQEGQGQGHDHVPRPRAGPPRARPGAARPALRRPRRAWRSSSRPPSRRAATCT